MNSADFPTSAFLKSARLQEEASEAYRQYIADGQTEAALRSARTFLILAFADYSLDHEVRSLSNEKQRLLRTSAAHVQPGGTYSYEELVDGVASGKLTVI